MQTGTGKFTMLPHNKLTEKALRRRLRTTMFGISAIIVFSLLAVFLFPTQVGSFFGFFSVHRNEKPYQPVAKPATPVFENAPEAVNDTKVTLMGNATPGTTIQLFVNGPEKASTTVGSDGVFTLADVPLNMGNNLLFAKAIDNNGIESDNSEFITITVDKEAPKIDLTNIKDGSTVRNLNKRIEIAGKVSEEATITINDNSVIQNKGDFTFDYWLGVSEGTVKIKIIATDMAGNKTEKDITVTYTKSG